MSKDRLEKILSNFQLVKSELDSAALRDYKGNLQNKIGH